MGKLKATIFPAGTRFGRWLIIEEVEPILRLNSNGRRIRRFSCVCDCGGKRIVLLTSLRNGQSRSCGCLRDDINSVIQQTHGHTVGYIHVGHRPEYRTWAGIIQRCTNPNASAFEQYGGRGIKVCDRWLYSFENFYADMGDRPPGCSIDRYPNNDGDYEPGNTRWATFAQQSYNKRQTVFLTWKGRRQTLAEWSAETGLSTDTIRQRKAKLKWSDEKALSTPPLQPPRRKVSIDNISTIEGGDIDPLCVE